MKIAIVKHEINRIDAILDYKEILDTFTSPTY